MTSHLKGCLPIYAKLGRAWCFKTGVTAALSLHPSFLLHFCLWTVVKMSVKNETNAPDEKIATDVPARGPGSFSDHVRGRQFSVDPEDHALVIADQNLLHRDLKGRHMQMIAM